MKQGFESHPPPKKKISCLLKALLLPRSVPAQRSQVTEYVPLETENILNSMHYSSGKIYTCADTVPFEWKTKTYNL